MSYDVSLSPDEAFVSVRVSSPLVKELALSFTRDAIQLANEHGIRSILFDVRGQQATDGMLNQYDYAQQLMDLGLKPDSRIAVLVTPGDDSHDFVEVATRNIGFVFHVFYEEQDAHDWLRQMKNISSVKQADGP